MVHSIGLQKLFHIRQLRNFPVFASDYLEQNFPGSTSLYFNKATFGFLSHVRF